MLAVPCAAQSGYRLQFDFDRPGLDVSHWQIIVPSHGLAQYTGTSGKGIDPGSVAFHLTDAGHARLGKLLAESKGLQPCETKTKNLANMGSKAVVFTPEGGEQQRCTFNYTDNKPLGDVASYLIATVETLQTGRELERLHRYDRLGLDKALLQLSESAKNGRAVELASIQPTLESIAADDALMERVRARASQLLVLAKQQDAGAP